MRYDLIVIGSGPGGQKAAIAAAKLGKRVAVIEKRAVVGGVCSNTGTIPSKSLRAAALHLTGYLERSFYGASYRVKERLVFEDLLQRTHRVIASEIQVIRDQLTRNSVTLVQGIARFVGPHTIEVTRHDKDVDRYDADFFVIAVGTKPARPTHVPFEDGKVVDSDGILRLGRIPRTMTVVGAGIIGIEYASIFSALGVEVTIVEKRPSMLEFVDREIVDSLAYQLRERGVIFRFNEEVASIVVDGDRVRATLASGKHVVSGALLYSAGRQGATAELGLEEVGVAPDNRGRIAVNAQWRTIAPHVFAVGDVIGFPSLASTSMEQGRLAACAAFGKEATCLPDLFPVGIYSIPEISMVGKTEEELTASSTPYEVGLARYREISRGQLTGDDTGILKMLFHRESRALLGVHAIGTDATELIHVGQAVMALGGTLDYFVRTVFNYPTFAECYKVAALDALNKLHEAM